MKSRVHTAVVACSCVMIAAAAAGCGGTASAAEQTARAGRAQDSTATAAAAEPFSLVVQMSGLLLLVPPKNPTGNTEVLMPDVRDHDAVIGFYRSSNSADCDAKYDSILHICYVKVNGWSVSAIGGLRPHGGLPKGAANLTHFAGKPINDISEAKGRSRAEVTLAAGLITDTCSLASWTFNPVGNDAPERLSLINVMEWIIPSVGAGPVSLLLTEKANPNNTRTLGPLEHNDENEFELLVLHLPETELQHIYTGVPVISPDRDQHGIAPGTANEMRAHFNAFYRTIAAEDSLGPIPQRPRRLRDVCPITVLGLQYRTAQGPSYGRGTKTLSCVMTSAEQS